jgi:hypothetical protein
MGKEYKTKAHQEAREGGYGCAGCNHELSSAKYEGEFTYVYDEEGNDQMVTVYLRCRCDCLNALSIDVKDPDGFMLRVHEAHTIPHRAKKITAEPAMAEAS